MSFYRKDFSLKSWKILLLTLGYIFDDEKDAKFVEEIHLKHKANIEGTLKWK